MKQKALIFLAFFIILLEQVSASSISGDIYLYENGQTRFDVETDVSLNINGLNFQNNKITGATSDLIIFQKGIWTFELKLGQYENIFLTFHIPQSLDSIISINSPDNIIDLDNKEITIIDSGELNFRLAYKLKSSTNLSWLFWPIIFILIACIYLIFKKLRKRKERFNQIIPFVNDLEKNILDLLMKKPMRQKEIRKKFNIPKASFSRYLANLEKKKLILREGEGKNKIVKLK